MSNNLNKFTPNPNEINKFTFKGNTIYIIIK